MVELDEVTKLRRNIASIYRFIGAEAGVCRGCGKEVVWLVSKNGKRAQFTADGLIHFADCPAADQFRKPKGAPNGDKV